MGQYEILKMVTSGDNKHIFMEKSNLLHSFRHKYGYMDLRRNKWQLSKHTYLIQV